MSTETLTRVEPAEFATRHGEVVALDDAARAIDGHESLGEAIWRDLDAPGPGSVGFLIEGRAYVHIARGTTHWIVGAVRRPDARDRDTTTRLLDAAVRHVRSHGGGRLECWVFGVTAADDDAFTNAGLTAGRELYEMRVALPLAVEPAWPAGTTVRAFERGRDELDWLGVNNRAFAGHPDQGGWTIADLEAREAEPWFDPALFLLAHDAHGLAGFNWLKLHAGRAPDPALGEIYVIGVDPRTHGGGLGRALAVAGLAAVSARGIGTGMLFVAADNEGALALYRSLGFAVHRTDRAYAADVDAR